MYSFSWATQESLWDTTAARTPKIKILDITLFDNLLLSSIMHTLIQMALLQMGHLRWSFIPSTLGWWLSITP